MKRVWMFIDGYNFYYAVKKYDEVSISYGNGRKIFLGWTDFRLLAEKYMLQYIDDNCELTKILYFTAEVKHLALKPGEADRQSLWLRAVDTIDGLEIYYGYYMEDDIKARVEKQTDVSIGVQLALGAAFDQYDAAILLCNDTDQIPSIEAVTADPRIVRPKTVHIWTTLSDTRANKFKRLDNDRGHLVTEEMLEQTRLSETFFDKKGNGPFECLLEWQAPRT